jgi:hypothetical protein
LCSMRIILFCRRPWGVFFLLRMDWTVAVSFIVIMLGWVMMDLDVDGWVVERLAFFSFSRPWDGLVGWLVGGVVGRYSAFSWLAGGDMCMNGSMMTKRGVGKQRQEGVSEWSSLFTCAKTLLLLSVCVPGGGMWDGEEDRLLLKGMFLEAENQWLSR